MRLSAAVAANPASCRGEGATAYAAADAQDVDTILREAARTLDQPVAVMCLMILQYVPDADDPHGIASRLLDAVPAWRWWNSGSSRSSRRSRAGPPMRLISVILPWATGRTLMRAGSWLI